MEELDTGGTSWLAWVAFNLLIGSCLFVDIRTGQSESTDPVQRAARLSGTISRHTFHLRSQCGLGNRLNHNRLARRYTLSDLQLAQLLLQLIDLIVAQIEQLLTGGNLILQVLQTALQLIVLAVKPINIFITNRQFILQCGGICAASAASATT